MVEIFFIITIKYILKNKKNLNIKNYKNTSSNYYQTHYKGAQGFFFPPQV